MYIKTVVFLSVITTTNSFTSFTTFSIPQPRHNRQPPTTFNMQFSKIFAIVSLSATAYSAAMPTGATDVPTTIAACNAAGNTSVQCCSGGLLNLLGCVNLLGSTCSNNGNAYCCKQTQQVSLGRFYQ
jgi:hypothetical protein